MLIVLGLGLFLGDGGVGLVLIVVEVVAVDVHGVDSNLLDACNGHWGNDFGDYLLRLGPTVDQGLVLGFEVARGLLPQQ